MNPSTAEQPRSATCAAAVWVARRQRWERWLDELGRRADGSGPSLPGRRADLRRVA